ncbi:MAG: hypothetical protein ACE15F_02865 [bacterium]
MNQFSDFFKNQVKHIRCVICGHMFAGRYDETIEGFPCYHPVHFQKRRLDCEEKFYREILRMYHYLHHKGESVTVKQILAEFDWNRKIVMKKDMMQWCFRQGYFHLDNLNRIEVPPPVEDTCMELFRKTNLEDPESLAYATELLKAALRCFAKDLVKPPEDQLPIRILYPEREEPPSPPENIPPIPPPRREPSGMVTAARTGARELEKRRHCASRTMERRRMDEKDAPYR